MKEIAPPPPRPDQPMYFLSVWQHLEIFQKYHTTNTLLHVCSEKEKEDPVGNDVMFQNWFWDDKGSLWNVESQNDGSRM